MDKGNPLSNSPICRGAAAPGCFWHHSNTFRFAVVLFLLTEGESERERSGNPPPYPLLALPRGSGLLAVGAPRAPLAPTWDNIKPKSAQERQKCFWGSQNTQKRRTRMKKCGLGDLGAPKRSKALKTQLCDSDPSEHQKTSYTYAKTQK